MTTTHWGDLPLIPDTDSGIAALEREQMTKPRPVEIEGPRLLQTCSSQHLKSSEPPPPEKFQIDPLTLHTIRLIQHARKMRHIIQMVQQQHENSKNDGEFNYPAAPPVPEYTGPPLKNQLSKPLSFLPKEESDFALGVGEPPPVIDSSACRKLVRRSVAAICAHAAFDNSKESILEFLTDMTQEYFLRLTRHLRAAADNQLLNEYTGFPDIVEQVFHEIGIGSVTNLHDFYQNRIIRYHENMVNTCQQLVVEYEKVKQAGGLKAAETFTLIRIKEEPCSEIQFPVLEEKDDVAEAEHLLQLESFGSYEITVEHEPATGLTTEMESKMAQSIKLEQSEGRLSILDGEEDPSNVREPPPTPQLSEAGDSIQDPNSVPVTDILSPPSITSRPPKPKKLKKV